jgi:glycosyltransferase involved in cell wall biosynthesis
VTDTMVVGRTGFVSESNDETTFTQKLRLLIENGELRSQMGREGYDFVSARFSKQKEIEITKELYLSLLKQKGQQRQQ